MYSQSHFLLIEPLHRARKINLLFSLLYDTPVDCNPLTLLGSLYFVSTLQSHRNEFHPRARACVFIGYPPVIKRYKLYDIFSKSYFICRDIVFQENYFFFHSIPHTIDFIDPFFDIILLHTAPDLPIYHSTSDLPLDLPTIGNNN